MNQTGSRYPVVCAKWVYMHRIMVVCLGIVGCLAVPARTPSFVQDLEAQVGASYVRVEDWPALPEGFQTGYVSAVDVDSHGHVFAFRRAGRQFDWNAAEPITEETVLMLDGEGGSLLAMWGADTFLVPHGLTIDQDDNVWLTDAIGHRVFKFSHDGALLLTLGEHRVPGWDGTHFNAPTEVAVQPDGSFFVADGYRNSRIANPPPPRERSSTNGAPTVPVPERSRFHTEWTSMEEAGSGSQIGRTPWSRYLTVRDTLRPSGPSAMWSVVWPMSRLHHSETCGWWAIENRVLSLTSMLKVG